MKETEIRADTGVSSARATVPEAHIKPAVVLSDAVTVSRSLGTFVVSDEEVWGFFDQAMTYIDMSKMTVDFSPSKKGETKRASLGILRPRSQGARASVVLNDMACWPSFGDAGGISV